MQVFLNITAAVTAFLVLTGGISQNFSSPEVFAALFLLLSGIAYKVGSAKRIEDLGWAGKHWLVLQKTPSAAAILFVSLLLLLFIAHCLRFLSLKVHGYDVSYVHQPLFYPLNNGVWFKSDAAVNASALGDHLTFSFFLLTPLTMLIKSPFFIFLLQVLIPGIMLWLVLTRTALKKHKDLIFYAVLIIFCSKGLRSGLLFDFREDVMGMAALLGMIYALWSKKISLYVIFFMTALLSKENIFVVTCFFSFPILFSKSLELNQGQRKGLVFLTVVGSLVYGVLAFKYILPQFALAPRAHPIFARYAEYGATPAAIALKILISPLAWWDIIKVTFSFADLKYLVFLLGPFVFFFRSKEAWVWASLALPGTLMNVAHDYNPQTMMIFHYELIIMPGLIAALLVSLKELKNRKMIFWGMLVALCFSGRWPAYYVTQNIPTLEQLEIYRTLSSLKSPQLPAVNYRFSAQVNHLSEYCLYEKIDSSPACKKVNTWIIDHEQAQEKARADELFKKGCEQLNPKLQNASVWVLSCKN